jgi:hypothetical protein
MREFTETIKVNGIDVEVLIKIDVQEDSCADLMDQDFETDEQRAEYVSKIERGEIFAGGIIVTASALGLTGTDSIWGCELAPNNMFNSKPFEQSVEQYLEEYDLKQTAIIDLVNQLKSEYARLTIAASEFKQFHAVD